MKMHCFDCLRETTFTTHDPEEGPKCDVCGTYQDSEAQGAAEVCYGATWHDLEAYEKTAEIARAGGFDVPEAPFRFVP